METEELINPPAPSGSARGNEENELRNSNSVPSEADSGSSNSEVKEDKMNSESLMEKKVNFEKENSLLTLGAGLDKVLVGKQLISQENIEVTETVLITEKIVDSSNSGVPIDNGCLTTPDEDPIGNHMIDGICILFPHLTCYT